jgi:hypothetical protein
LNEIAPPRQLHRYAASTMSQHQYHFEINLVDQTEARIPATVDCEVTYWNEGNFTRRSCAIHLAFDETTLDATDHDFFRALCVLREQLTTRGLSPLCYGASRNVHPSGMLVDMSNGLRAYRLRIGHRGNAGIVGIFDAGDDLDIVSVEAQRQFYEEWLQSFRGAA